MIAALAIAALMLYLLQLRKRRREARATQEVLAMLWTRATALDDDTAAAEIERWHNERR